jgi:hypothetical protein
VNVHHGARIVLNGHTIAQCTGPGCKCVSCYNLNGSVSAVCYRWQPQFRAPRVDPGCDYRSVPSPEKCRLRPTVPSLFFLVSESERTETMAEALLITLALIVVAIATILGFPYVVRHMDDWNNRSPQTSPQGVVKHDWLPTGRIDFTTRVEDVPDQSKDKPGDFKLLVEERRIVESLAGNENLEIQWRLATLSEAKAVVTQYHKYLSENSLIKSVPEFVSLPAPRLVS